ncbi:MAG: hypothetical protein AAF485_00385 [Chloroflexota bacterium]
MMNQTTNYQSYLLRFRRRDDRHPWYCTVRTVRTEAQHHFATLDELVAFLATQLDADHSWEVKVQGLNE